MYVTDLKILASLFITCFGVISTIGQQCDDATSHCSQWPGSHCRKYRIYMKKYCPKRCGYCGTTGVDCSDKRRSCQKWKSYGYCNHGHIYHTYMKINCANTCGFCGSCFLTKKLKSCTFDLDSCDFVDVPFTDDHDFVLKSSGGQDGKGYLSSSGYGSAELIVPLELLVPYNEDLGNLCMEFYYRIRRGSLKVFQVTNTKNYVKSLKLHLTDTRGSWTKARMYFRASQKYHLLFKATPKSGSVHIDNVQFCGKCS
ncbi:uncharacterized protein LOC124438722 isoform X2 [Xenia sp. Carnegie-2017]|uniref:uncharacterized protein LOC124438722 isoform X2 n=1 Tax=Xenia sp. Carnegie-2017 TaxID=2897299 RepID=UPI001F034003|nr:uncharacterized protein LOC124438722 isoform X2 [Xenia sp. Carnegie-2017]